MSILKNVVLKPDLSSPLYQQIYEHLRAAILSGQLQRGAKLPSTRALADELGISRNTVLNAYDQLFAEGYLQSVEGRGTFIAHVLPEVYLAPPSNNPGKQSVSRQHHLSERAQAMLTAPAMPARNKGLQRAFQAGLPALDAFPFELWGKLVARRAHQLHPDMLTYQDRAGYRPLREAITSHIIVTRQVRCTPEQVIIVTGSQGGLHLAARVLLNPGDSAWIEDPGYLGARSALLSAGAKLIPVPVDDSGLIVERGIARAPDARLAYLTPSHQFPLGSTLSLARRLALLDWAEHADAYLLEDDYDSEYRFEGRPLASLQGLDENERVIYAGTFSKVLFPALRLGYLVVPEALVNAFLTMHGAMDYHLPSLEQTVVTDFITEGHFTRHIRRMRTLYAERRALLVDAARDLPLDMFAPEAGMHLVGWLPAGCDDRLAAERAAEHQVAVMPISLFALEPGERGGLVLGYAATTESDILDGVRRLEKALRFI
jgi:GntR family transcriptional regulator/MocR family aminotransferase